jgi:hypothetical protein
VAAKDPRFLAVEAAEPALEDGIYSPWRLVLAATASGPIAKCLAVSRMLTMLTETR